MKNGLGQSSIQPKKQALRTYPSCRRLGPLTRVLERVSKQASQCRLNAFTTHPCITPSKLGFRFSQAPQTLMYTRAVLCRPVREGKFARACHFPRSVPRFVSTPCSTNLCFREATCRTPRRGFRIKSCAACRRQPVAAGKHRTNGRRTEASRIEGRRYKN